jgi:MarR family transcriptional regulator, organic hydroperoxide resistance regulator
LIGYLLAQVCRAHRARAQELLAVIGLHPGQEMMLLRLWPGDGMAQSQLAEEMCVQPATLTKMIDRVERSGLVLRRPDAEDQRISRVYLTDTGRAAQAPAEQAWSVLEAESMATLTLEERILLRRLLLQVLSNLS